jgi:ubiquinone/menaquinone biosynthesis C-methylase UbiE
MKLVACALSVMLLGLASLPAAAQHEAGAPGGAGQHMDHSFADVERYAKSFDDPARDAWQMPDRVIGALGLKAGAVVADIGAGTGYFSIRLAKSPGSPKVIAADVEPKMLDHIRSRAMADGLENVITVAAGAESPNLPEPVDVVLIVDTFHHIPNRVAYFTALKRSMKPGARLAIVDFRKDSPEGPPVEFRFSAEQITGELAKAGFSRTAQHDFLPRQLFLIYEAR